jgi:hypothetical protein
MSCNCKNKEYHPCQNGGECKCGGKCKKENYSNSAGSLDDFKGEDSNVSKIILQLVGGLSLAIISLLIYKQISN